MSTNWRVFFAVLTLVCTLAILCLTVWSAFMAFWGITFVGSLLTIMFGVLVAHDYQFFFSKKTLTPPNNETLK